nr:sodium-dependent phosphate transporter 1-like [Ciona intestinalis]|eukprot:XP_026692334.1 sodium-dependent phosphate transporter 1-like [Ciona intestinalis]
MDTTTAFSSVYGSSTSVPWTSESFLWMLITGFVAAIVLSFSVGANDVANSFGTTVGSKAITIRQACILATIFETSGALLIGAKVGETIRKGIIDVEVYSFDGGTEILMTGQVSAMFGSAMWQLLATCLRLPVSGTHSIVGASIGFSLVAVGAKGVSWKNLGFIVVSWFVSPVLAGFASVVLYYFISKYILDSNDPLQRGLKLLPMFYSVTVGLNLFSILYSGAPVLGLDNLPLWGVALVSGGGMLLIAIATLFIIVPRVKKKSEELMRSEASEKKFDESVSSCSSESHEKASRSSIDFDPPPAFDTVEACSRSLSSNKSVDYKHETVVFLKGDTEKAGSSRHGTEKTCMVQLRTSDHSINDCGPEDSTSVAEDTPEDDAEKDDPIPVRQLFSSLQVLTACFASFAHGGNDVSNAIGPLIALWMIYWSGGVGQVGFTPWYLLLYGGAGISLGVWTFGRGVMKTIGEDLTKVTASRGFCIELMTAATVLIASNIGIPISTTHCKVGAVVSIGWYGSRAAVDWSVARNIACAWFVTVPVSGLLSAGCMFLLMQFL